MAKQPQTPFSRLQAPDAATNRAVQDLYDKLQQAQLAISQLQSAPAVAAAVPAAVASGGAIFYTSTVSTSIVTTYMSPVVSSLSTTEPSRMAPVPSQGKFKALTVYLASTLGGSGVLAVTLRVNGLSTKLSVIIPPGSLAGTYACLSGAEIDSSPPDTWDLLILNNTGGSVTLQTIAIVFG